MRPGGRAPAAWGLALLAGVALGFVLLEGAARGRGALPPRAEPVPWHARLGWGPTGDPHGLGDPGAAALRERLLAQRLAGLPAGVGLDPDTGYLVGLDLRPKAGERLLAWGELDRPGGEGEGAVPEALEALDGERALLAGFATPLLDAADRRHFALIGSHLACCFGRPPGPGGIVRVTLAADAPPVDLGPAPVLVRGRLRLDPWRLEGDRGPPLSLFALEEARWEPLPAGGG